MQYTVMDSSRVVAIMLSKIWFPTYTFEEILSTAWLKIQRQKENTSLKYLILGVNNELVRDTRKRNNRGMTCVGDKSLKIGTGDVFAARYHDEHVSFKEDISHYLSVLIPRQREVVEATLQGKTQTDIANDMGVTRQRVSQIYSESLEKMQKKYLTELNAGI